MSLAGGGEEALVQCLEEGPGPCTVRSNASQVLVTRWYSFQLYLSIFNNINDTRAGFKQSKDWWLSDYLITCWHTVSEIFCTVQLIDHWLVHSSEQHEMCRKNRNPLMNDKSSEVSDTKTVMIWLVLTITINMFSLNWPPIHPWSLYVNQP